MTDRDCILVTSGLMHTATMHKNGAVTKLLTVYMALPSAGNQVEVNCLSWSAD